MGYPFFIGFMLASESMLLPDHSMLKHASSEMLHSGGIGAQSKAKISILLISSREFSA